MRVTGRSFLHNFCSWTHSFRGGETEVSSVLLEKRVLLVWGAWLSPLPWLQDYQAHGETEEERPTMYMCVGRKFTWYGRWYFGPNYDAYSITGQLWQIYMYIYTQCIMVHWMECEATVKARGINGYPTNGRITTGGTTGLNACLHVYVQVLTRNLACHCVIV